MWGTWGTSFRSILCTKVEPFGMSSKVDIVWYSSIYSPRMPVPMVVFIVLEDEYMCESDWCWCKLQDASACFWCRKSSICSIVYLLLLLGKLFVSGLVMIYLTICLRFGNVWDVLGEACQWFRQINGAETFSGGYVAIILFWNSHLPICNWCWVPSVFPWKYKRIQPVGI